MSIKVEDFTITTKRSIRYLVAEMDKITKMAEHVNVVTKKAEVAAVALNRFVGGPKPSNGRTLSMVIYILHLAICCPDMEKSD